MTFYLARMSVTEPLVYHIRVAGTLEPGFSDYVSGMTIAQDTTSDGSVVSDLHGTLPDHSALVGVLRTLTNLSLPIINVQCLGVPSEAPQGDGTGDVDKAAAAANGDGIAVAAEDVASEATTSPPKRGHGRLGAGVGAFVGGLLGLAGGPETGAAGAILGSGVGLYLGKRSGAGNSWSTGLRRFSRPFARGEKPGLAGEPAGAPSEA